MRGAASFSPQHDDALDAREIRQDLDIAPRLFRQGANLLRLTDARLHGEKAACPQILRRRLDKTRVEVHAVRAALERSHRLIAAHLGREALDVGVGNVRRVREDRIVCRMGKRREKIALMEMHARTESQSLGVLSRNGKRRA